MVSLVSDPPGRKAASWGAPAVAHTGPSVETCAKATVALDVSHRPPLLHCHNWGVLRLHPTASTPLLYAPRPWRLAHPTPSRWCRGSTGLPFVDANMRELAATGWMSNRGRQNVASFLTKDLGVDWRWGAWWGAGARANQ